ncbi:hypothetical protein OPV22_013799 [Ensete ventricosum]|uniref:Uncharacterized protein n=1 Tax=Ensete ventricosum TaxID=4639 RepID=A0AAV8R1T3_ENSVE|nr:hypothetical protein OPV22_013799 [Ensete ventricosum]
MRTSDPPFQPFKDSLVECFELGIIELYPIVDDDDPWEVEPGDDVLPNEPFDLFFSDGHQRFSLDPFSEIVDPDYKKAALAQDWGEMSQGDPFPIEQKAKHILRSQMMLSAGVGSGKDVILLEAEEFIDLAMVVLHLD